MSEPMKFGGPESVAKPFEILGSFFSKLGKNAGEKERRKQVFDDTVKLHKELAEVETEQHGARFQQIEAHHKAMAEIASRSSTTVGTSSTAATYRAPKSVTESPTEEAAKDKPVKEPAKTSKKKTAAPNTPKQSKTSSTTPPKVKKAPAPKPTPKVDKERQELNESL